MGTTNKPPAKGFFLREIACSLLKLAASGFVFTENRLSQHIWIEHHAFGF